MVSKLNTSPVIESTQPGAVLLPTISVKVQAGERSAYIRGIVAWTSKYNLISEKCMMQFDLPAIEGPVPSPHGALGAAIEIVGTSYIKFSPHNNEDHTIALEVYVAKTIDPTPTSSRLHPMVRESLKGLQLADPFFDEPGDIDLVLGVSFSPLVLKQGRYMVPGTGCFAMESIFGWIVVGEAPMMNVQEEEEDSPHGYLRMQ